MGGDSESIVMSQWRLLVNAGQAFSGEGDFARHSGRSVNAGNVISIAHFGSVVGGVVDLTSAIHVLLDAGTGFCVVDVHGTGPAAGRQEQRRDIDSFAIKFSVSCRMTRIHSEQVTIRHVHLGTNSKETTLQKTGRL